MADAGPVKNLAAGEEESSCNRGLGIIHVKFRSSELPIRKTCETTFNFTHIFGHLLAFHIQAEATWSSQ